MDWIRNLPLFCITVALFSGVVASVVNGKIAKYISIGLILSELIANLLIFYYVLRLGNSYTYTMGHFPAPWGNEIRIGVLEAFTASFFCIILLLAVLGGLKHIKEDIQKSKQNLYFVMVNLLISSLIALIYTNDLFTAYVFVEINTIAACALIMIRQTGRSILAATKYMIMSLLGSGLFLIGIILLYDLTGHLLMENIKESISQLAATGQYAVPLTVIIGLLSVGLAIKSALYPFHAWLPDAYSFSTPASGALLSSLVSKVYIFLLIKIIYRVIGFDVIISNKITNVLFVFGLIGIIMGSISAIRENDMRRMIAFSSIAQIGYIYMGIGLGTSYGIVAALFHIFSHGASKALLFISASGLFEVSGNSKKFKDLKGAAFRNRIAGAGFLVGAFSMIGIPLFAGFTSKLYFATASVRSPHKMIPTLVVLAISTILNSMYFLRAVIRIYTPVEAEKEQESSSPIVREKQNNQKLLFRISMVCFIVLNFLLGMLSQPIIGLIEKGLQMFY